MGSVTPQVVPRRKWSPAASGPAGPCKAATDGPPLPQMVPPPELYLTCIVTLTDSYASY